MTVTLYSNSPPGGRCTLYARYAETIRHSFDDATVNVTYPGKNPGSGPTPPALAVNDRVVAPSDGVIVAPEDIVATLAEAGFHEQLEECHAKLKRIQDDFLTEMSRTA